MATTRGTFAARRSLTVATVALVGATLLNSALLASSKPKPYALIFGTVWGKGDVPLYGIKIKIRRTNEKKARWELYSDHRGEFAQRLPAGTADYIVWTEPEKHSQAADSAQVTVHIDNDERRDIGLHLKQ